MWRDLNTQKETKNINLEKPQDTLVFDYLYREVSATNGEGVQDAFSEYVKYLSSYNLTKKKRKKVKKIISRLKMKLVFLLKFKPKKI